MARQRLSVQTAALADFSPEDTVQLAYISAHAFRHRFGVRAVARKMRTAAMPALTSLRLPAENIGIGAFEPLVC